MLDDDPDKLWRGIRTVIIYLLAIGAALAIGVAAYNECARLHPDATWWYCL